MQNVGIKWTPGNVALNQYLGLYVVQNSPNGAPGLTSLIVHRTRSFEQFDLEHCLNLTSVSFPELVSMDGNTHPAMFIFNNPVLALIDCPSLVTCGEMFCNDNPLLTNINVPVLDPPITSNLDFHGNALTQACVDQVLRRCVLEVTWAALVDVSGGTSSAPSAAGLADKATLIARGATVNTN